MWLLAAPALLAAGCGGGGGRAFTVEKTQSCLVDKGFRIGHAVDFVASTATGGAFRTYFPENDVTVVFGRTQEDAVNLEQAYRRFHAKNVGIDDVLSRDRNAVLLWRFHPSDADRTTLGSCLSG